MCAERGRPVAASVILVLLVAFGAGCGRDEPSAAEDPRPSTALPRGPASLPSSTTERTAPSSSEPTVTWATTSTAPPPPRPTTCGSTVGPDDIVVTVAITAGAGDCAAAEALIRVYYDDLPAPDEAPDRLRDIDGWLCTIEQVPDEGPVTTCQLAGYGVIEARP